MKRLILGAAFGCLMSAANARDLGQWQSVNPEVREWYQALMQSDNPAISCGEADAYWSDLEAVFLGMMLSWTAFLCVERQRCRYC
jgi:hypothetical protein